VSGVEGEARTVMALPPDLHVNSREWLHGNPKYSYQNWKKGVPHQTG